MFKRLQGATAALILAAAIGCNQGPAAPQLVVALEEAPAVDCEKITLEQAEEILRGAAVWDYLRAQDPAPTDEDLVEAAKLICTGAVTPNRGVNP